MKLIVNSGVFGIQALELAAIHLLWIACVFDPSAGFFKIKFIAVSLVLVVLLLRFLLGFRGFNFNANYLIIVLPFLFYLPIYGMFVSSLRGGAAAPFIDTSYITSVIYLFCSLLYMFPGNLSIAYKAMIQSLRLLCFVMLLGLGGLLLGSREFLDFFVENGAAFIGDREYSGIGFYYIYFIVSPMLVFLVCNDTWSFIRGRSIARFSILMLSVAALFLSGTRANMIIAVLAPLFVFIWYAYGKFSLLLLVLAAIFFFLVLNVFDVPVLSDMFSADDDNNYTKLSYLPGYIEIFGNLDNFFWGQGFNAHLWSGVVFEMLPEGASKTELTYLEMLRVFGFWNFFFWIIVIGFMVLSKRINDSPYPWLAPALFLYLVVSASNPYIFSSNGMLLFGFVAAVIGCSKKNQKRLLPD